MGTKQTKVQSEVGETDSSGTADVDTLLPQMIVHRGRPLWGKLSSMDTDLDHGLTLNPLSVEDLIQQLNPEGELAEEDIHMLSSIVDPAFSLDKFEDQYLQMLANWLHDHSEISWWGRGKPSRGFNLATIVKDDKNIGFIYSPTSSKSWSSGRLWKPAAFVTSSDPWLKVEPQDLSEEEVTILRIFASSTDPALRFVIPLKVSDDDNPARSDTSIEKVVDTGDFGGVDEEEESKVD